MVNLVGGFLAKFTKDRQANKNKNLLADVNAFPSTYFLTSKAVCF